MISLVFCGIEIKEQRALEAWVKSWSVWYDFSLDPPKQTKRKETFDADRVGEYEEQKNNSVSLNHELKQEGLCRELLGDLGQDCIWVNTRLVKPMTGDVLTVQRDD